MTTPLKPDFSTIRTRQVELPYDTEPFLDLSFRDPLLQGYEVKVIADTAPDSGLDSRLTTIIVRFPRVVLAEMNTHRVFSRNSASSRARSIKVTLRDVMEAPYIPLFTQNRRGMSGEYVDAATRERAIPHWLRSRDAAVAGVLRLLLGDMIDPALTDQDIVAEWEAWVDTYQEEVYLSDTPDERALSIHKQNVNRLLEPFMWHEAVITSSYWENFLDLRAHLEAQPEIAAVGFLVQAALQASEPEKSMLHLPFIARAERDAVSLYDTEALTELFLRSSFEAAQISYHDKSSQARTTATWEKGLMLLREKHLSPFEHPALAVEALSAYNSSISGLYMPSRNFSSTWAQFRAIVETPEIHHIIESLQS